MADQHENIIATNTIPRQRQEHRALGDTAEQRTCREDRDPSEKMMLRPTTSATDPALSSNAAKPSG